MLLLLLAAARCLLGSFVSSETRSEILLWGALFSTLFPSRFTAFVSYHNGAARSRGSAFHTKYLVANNARKCSHEYVLQVVRDWQTTPKLAARGPSMIAVRNEEGGQA